MPSRGLRSHDYNTFTHTQTHAVWCSGDAAKFAGGGERHNETVTTGEIHHRVADLNTMVFADGQEIGAFQYCTKLRTLSLHSSLRGIGDWSFFNCLTLKHMELPASLLLTRASRRVF